MSASWGIKQNDSFQIQCGEIMLMLEQYKLKSNLANCHMGKEDFKKYFNYINGKSKKRLDFVGGKIMSLVRVFQRNQIFLQALELRTVNNMLRNYRKRMDLQENEQINYSRFDKEETDLTQIILSNDLAKRDQILKIMGKVKYLQDEKSMEEVLQGILKKKRDFKQYAYSKAFKLIAKSEVHYSSYYDSFQLSLSNMVNQIHAHLQKLNKFYTLWENLGSSLIYEIKSNKEVLIDKTIEERRNKYFSYHEEDQDEINQVIDVMPARSKIRQQYCEKLNDIKSRTGKHFSGGGVNPLESGPRHKTGNLKEGHQTITKVSWYETNAEDIKECNFGSEMNTLQEKQQSYFKYTYEELHKETTEYMEEFKNKKGLTNLNLNGQESYGDRFYVFCQKKNKLQGQDMMDTTLNNYGSPQMSFSCWFDRLGTKGVFNIMDYPANLVQRRIEYENDRQMEMQNLDDRRRKQYNNKQSKLDFLEDQGGYNIGYKYLDSNKELQELRSYITSQYNADYLPLPKKGEQRVMRKNEHSDFSDESQQQQHFKIEVCKKKQEKITLPNEGEKKTKIRQSTNSMASEMFIKNLKSKRIPSKSQECPEISVKQIQERYEFVDLQKKQKDILELFTLNYLPVFEKSILHKLRIKSKAGIEDEVCQILEYIYLKNFGEGELKTCLNSRTEKDNLNKIYFVNKLFYFKVEPLFFTNRGKIIKITFCLATEIPGFEKLKVNLENLFKPFGTCKFQLNTNFVQKKELSDLNKFYGIVGDLLRDIRQQKNRIYVEKVFEKSTEKKQYEKQKEENEMSIALISEGEKAYESYKNHCMQLKNYGENQ